jgi:threonine dehydrogenase-like Zn-dependent dehydrogenase
LYDKAKTLVGLGTDRAHALREAIMCCRKAGTVSVPGVYVGFPDKFPMGAFMNKGLTIKTGQTHTQRYTGPLLEKISEGRDRPVVRHHPPAATVRRPGAYRIFRDKQDQCVKVVLKP